MIMEKKVLKERVEKLCQMAADKGNSLDMTEVLDQLGDLKVTPGGNAGGRTGGCAFRGRRF